MELQENKFGQEDYTYNIGFYYATHDDSYTIHAYLWVTKNIHNEKNTNFI